jgi:hypothetical protein
MRVLQVPEVFMDRNCHEYPPGNHNTMEEYFFDHTDFEKVESPLAYLPVFWTNYIVNHNYGRDASAMQRLQDFVGTIDQPWVTISQNDDGIIIDRSKLKVKTVSLNAGGEGDIPLPMCRTPIEYPMRDKPKWFASFVGSVTNEAGKTNIRQEMIRVLGNKSEFHFYPGYTGVLYYRDTMASSKFALCPRGYGKTSFRLYEALQVGTVPVYISDVHWLPFQRYVDWDKIAIIMTPDRIPSIHERLASISESVWKEMSDAGMRAWRDYFSFEGFRNTTIKMIEEGL